MKAIPLAFSGLLGAAFLMPLAAQTSTAERDALKFERAKLAAARAQMQKEPSAGEPRSLNRSESTKPEAKIQSAEAAARRFEQTKLAAAQQELKKDAAANAAAAPKQPAVARPATAVNLPSSNR